MYQSHITFKSQHTVFEISLSKKTTSLGKTEVVQQYGNGCLKIEQMNT